MESLLAQIGMPIVLFASTNVDDVFVLVGFFADKRFRTRDTVLGQYVGITALFGASVAASLLSLVIPRAYIGLLGVIPILIGGKKLFELYQPRDRTEETLEHHSNANRNGRVATVALVTLANGGDNIGIYTPSFAIRSAHEIIVIALVFVVMTALCCFVAHAMVNHPKLGSPIRRYAHRMTPVVLVGLGVLILYQAGSFGLLQPAPLAVPTRFEQGLWDNFRVARHPGSTANLSDRASDQFRYADFAGESLMGIAGWANHNGSLKENPWPRSTTLIARDSWKRKVIRDETDDTCGDVGRWAVRNHRR